MLCSLTLSADSRVVLLQALVVVALLPEQRVLLLAPVLRQLPQVVLQRADLRVLLDAQLVDLDFSSI